MELVEWDGIGGMGWNWWDEMELVGWETRIG
jgi:hypothetical protein